MGWLCLGVVIVLVGLVLVAALVPPQREVLHKCAIVWPILPDDVAKVKAPWRCPTCKQRWKLETVVGGGKAVRNGRPSTKWSKEAGRAVKTLTENPPKRTDEALTVPDEWTIEN